MQDTGGGSHILQQEAPEQRARTQQEGEGASEDHDHVKQEPEAVVPWEETTWVEPGVAWGLGACRTGGGYSRGSWVTSVSQELGPCLCGAWGLPGQVGAPSPS